MRVLVPLLCCAVAVTTAVRWQSMQPAHRDSTVGRVHGARRQLAVALSLHAAAVSGPSQAEALTEAMTHIKQCLAIEMHDYQLQFYAAVNVDRLLRDHPPAAVSRPKVSRAELQTYCTMARESLDSDRDDVLREQPLVNLRYLYTICCESLRPVGGDGPASRTRRLREACWSEAVAQGAWPRMHQRPMELNASLIARPVWSMEELHAASDGGAAMVRLLRAVGSRWSTLRTEALAALRRTGGAAVREREGLHERGRWDELPFVVHGVRNDTSCRLCPMTCAMLAPFERLGATDGGPGAVGQIKLSVLAPGDTYIKPHVGPNNRRLRAHLPLSGLEGASLLVAGIELRWSALAVGDWLVFDDSFEHEVSHTGEAARLVLIVDLPHPQLVVWDPDADVLAQAAEAERICDIGGSSSSCAPTTESGGAALAALVWPHPPDDFLAQLWQRRGAIMTAHVPSSLASVSSRAFFRRDGAIQKHLLGFEGFWALLEDPVLVAHDSKDRYGGFVKVITGTMRKWQLHGGRGVQQQQADEQPLSLAEEARRQYRLGNTIVVENVELFHEAVARLCSELTEALLMEVNVNLYLTPSTDDRGSPSRSFPRHTDLTDIFVLQLDGAKHWEAFFSPVYLTTHRPYQNSEGAAADTHTPQWPPSAGVYNQTFLTATLTPGDVLYLPAHWVHRAQALPEQSLGSLHLTITPKTQQYRCDVLLDQVLEVLPTYMQDAEPWVFETVLLMRTEVHLLSNGSSDAGPWLRQALAAPHPAEPDGAHSRHEQLLNALRKLDEGLAGEARYSTGLCSWAPLLSPTAIKGRGDPDFVVALTERDLSPSDRSVLERELVTDGPTLRSLSEADLQSVGIRPALERQAVFAAAKQQHGHMRRLIEELLAEATILAPIVTLVWEQNFRTKLAEFNARLGNL